MSDRIAELIRRAEAEGLIDVAYAHVDSPIGRLTVASSAKGLVRVSFPREDETEVLDELATRVSPRVLEAPGRLDEVRRELDEYFEGKRTDFALPLDWSLVRSDFRLRVLEQTALIPYGHTLTYRQMATLAGNERAMRAAGTALGSNPIPVVVPCHRVIGSDGSLTGYGGGLEVKEQLLVLEGVLPARLG